MEELDKKQEWGLPSIGITPEILFNPIFSNSEKILYGFLRNLISQPKGCFATNRYLGNLCGLKKNAVSKAITKFEALGIISINFYRDGFNGVKRVITASEEIPKTKLAYIKEYKKEVYKKIKNCEDWANDKNIIELGINATELYLNEDGKISVNPPEHNKLIKEKIDNLNLRKNYEEKEEDDEHPLLSHSTIGDIPPNNSVYSPRQQGILSSTTNEEENKEDREEENSSENSKEFSIIESNNDSSEREHKKFDRKDIGNQIKDQMKSVTKETKVKLSIENKRIIEHWNNQGLHPLSLESNTTVLRNVNKQLKELRKGTFFNHTDYVKYKNRPFTNDEIIKVINDFALKALNLNFAPINDYKNRLAKTTLERFIYNEFSTVKSLFIDCIENKPVLASHSLGRRFTDEHPKLTNSLKLVYNREILGSVKVDYDVVSDNHFIQTAKKIMDFYSKNKSKFSLHIMQSYGNINSGLAELFIESVVKYFGENKSEKIGVAFLNRTDTVNRIFPAYLFKEAVITE